MSTAAHRIALVVDDSMLQRAHLVDMLRNMNYGAVLQAADGAEALRLLDQQGDEPIHLIITDIDMPGMDGIELIGRLTEKLRATNLIATSARDPRLLETVESLSAPNAQMRLLGTLTKPVMPAALTRILAGADQRATQIPDRRLDDLLTLSDIEVGLELGQFVPYVQPKVAMNSGLLCGVESLARWIHPEHGLLAPQLFIPKTEGTPLMPRFTLSIVEQSLVLLRDWTRALPTLTMSINLSADDLADQSFAETLVERVRHHGLAPQSVIWEVTETMIMRSQAMANLARLGLKGFGLSMDDYGVGYSSMQTLSRSPFTELKIDRIFVDGASERANRRAILVSSVDMGRRLGITTVAEGVEREADWHLLRELGCDSAQGYMIARPMPADELLAWTRANRARLRGLAGA